MMNNLRRRIPLIATIRAESYYCTSTCTPSTFTASTTIRRIAQSSCFISSTNCRNLVGSNDRIIYYSYSHPTPSIFYYYYYYNNRYNNNNNSKNQPDGSNLVRRIITTTRITPNDWYQQQQQQQQGYQKRQHQRIGHTTITRCYSTSSSSSSKNNKHPINDNKNNNSTPVTNNQSLLLLRAPNQDDIIVFQSILSTCQRSGSLIVHSSLLSTNKNSSKCHEDEIDENNLLLETYNIDWTKHYNSNCLVLLRPETVEQISEIIKYCYQEHIGIIPVGGRTGLVGGAVGSKVSYNNNNEILLSVERLNQIDDDIIIVYDKDSKSCSSNSQQSTTNSTAVRCQAGCIVQDVQDYCSRRHNMLLPIDLGSKGSCQIGGVISTNAGGSYYTRYGSIASNLLGIQIVTGTGDIIDLNYTNPIYKDNATGYKLHQLVVGSEGTLGIITGVVMNCYVEPTSKQALYVICRSFDNVQQTIVLAQQILGEIIAACEWMDSNVMQCILKQQKEHIQNPFPDSIQKLYDESIYHHYVLIETHGSNVQHDQEKMNQFIEFVLGQQQSDDDDNNGNNTTSSPVVIDGIIAQDINQRNDFWKIRELCNPTITSMGYGYKYDLSLPAIPNQQQQVTNNFYNFIQLVQNRINETFSNNEESDDDDNLIVKNYNWGHLLDNNIHLNIVAVGKYDKDERIVNCLEPYIFEQIIAIGGSISAEHGLGQAKNYYLPMIHNTTKLQYMYQIKSVFDPHNILNPGKFLP